MLSLLLALTAPIPAADPILVTASALHAERAPVRLHLNGGDYRPGDRVRVEVETSEDGYLVVFRVDADGLVRVLFPLDPDLDAYVRGGKRYELRGRGDRETFLADDAGGTGLIYAALSREPMDLRRYATGSHWDYNELKLQSDDPEAELSWFVRQFTSNGLFEYDVLGYRVYGPGFEEAVPVVVTGGGGYYDPYYYGSSYGYGYPRTGLNISIGAQFGRPYYYDPYYDPWYGFGYSGYGYGGYGYRFGGFGYYPYRHITVFPTPTHGVVSNPIYGVRSRPRAPLAGVGSFADGVGGVSTVANGGRNVGVDRNTGGGGGSRGEFTTGSRPRTPQGGAQRPQSQSQSGGQDPRRVGGTTTGTAGRSAPAPVTRPTTPAPADRGERSRRPTSSAGQPASPAPTITQRRTDERSLSPAATDRPAAATRVGSRPTSRPTTSSTDADRPAARPTSERRAAERPVYRPPTSSTSGSDGARNSGDRPAASSRPRQVDRPAPSTGRSAERPAASPRSEPASRSPRPSVDRQQSGSVDRGSRSSPEVRSAPATRSAPEARSAPSNRSAPAARSAPSSSSRGSSGGGGRSRGRGSSD